MNRFFPGQPVRIRYCISRPELNGVETRVVRGPDRLVSAATLEEYEGYTVEVDPRFGPKAEQLEPILPDGHRSGDYSLIELMDRCKQGEGVSA